MSAIKLLFILVFLYVGYKIVRMILGRERLQNTEGYRVDATPSKGEDLVQDPLCKTYVPKSQAYLKEINGRDQYFCSQECCEKYLSGEK